jgi:hypothetical protein
MDEFAGRVRGIAFELGEQNAAQLALLCVRALVVQSEATSALIKFAYLEHGHLYVAPSAESSGILYISHAAYSRFVCRYRVHFICQHKKYLLNANTLRCM